MSELWMDWGPRWLQRRVWCGHLSKNNSDLLPSELADMQTEGEEKAEMVPRKKGDMDRFLGMSEVRQILGGEGE